MPGPEDLQVSHLDPGYGLHVTCMHSVTGFEVCDLSVFWAGHAQLAYANYHMQCRWRSNAIEIYCSLVIIILTISVFCIALF